MVLQLDLRGWRSIHELLLGYSADEVAAYRAVVDFYRAGREAAKRVRSRSVGGAAVGGFLNGLNDSAVSLASADSVRAAIGEPGSRHYSTRQDVRDAHREMRARRDARLRG